MCSWLAQHFFCFTVRAKPVNWGSFLHLSGLILINWNWYFLSPSLSLLRHHWIIIIAIQKVVILFEIILWIQFYLFCIEEQKIHFKLWRQSNWSGQFLQGTHVHCAKKQLSKGNQASSVCNHTNGYVIVIGEESQGETKRLCQRMDSAEQVSDESWGQKSWLGVLDPDLRAVSTSFSQQLGICLDLYVFLWYQRLQNDLRILLLNEVSKPTWTLMAFCLRWLQSAIQCKSEIQTSIFPVQLRRLGRGSASWILFTLILMVTKMRLLQYLLATPLWTSKKLKSWGMI